MHDQHQFDELARAVASGVSRRAMLQRLGQGLFGALVAAWGWRAGPAEAGGAAPTALAGTRSEATPGANACHQICERSAIASTRACEAIDEEDTAIVATRFQTCLAGCAEDANHRTTCRRTCEQARLDLQERVDASRHACLDGRRSRRQVCISSCGG